MDTHRVTYHNVIDGQRHVLLQDLTAEEASNLARNMTEEGMPGCRVERPGQWEPAVEH